MDPLHVGRGQVERSWGIPDPLGGVLHGIEMCDVAADEVIAWAFAVERDDVLDIEEFFVRPAWRSKGYGNLLAGGMLRLSGQCGRPLRAWVAHVDATTANRPALSATMRAFGLEVRRSSEPWASGVGLGST